MRFVKMPLIVSLCVFLMNCGGGGGGESTPTVSIVKPVDNQSLVGTATYEISFSDPASGLNGNTAAGDCIGNVQLTSTLGVTCYPLTINSADGLTWSVDPDGELSDGTYTLTVLPTGITNSTGNALEIGATVTFTINDPVSTVLNNLSQDLANGGISTALAGDIQKAARAASDNLTDDQKDLLGVIPAVLEGALDVVSLSSATTDDKAEAISLVFQSMMKNVAGKTSLQSAYSSRIAAAGGGNDFNTLLGYLSEIIGRKGDSSNMAVLTSALVNSLPAAGASVADVSSTYVVIIVEETTKSVMNNNTDDTDRDSLLGAMGTGIQEGASQITTDKTVIAAISTTTISTLTNTAEETDPGYVVSGATSELPDVIPPTFTLSLGDAGPINTNSIVVNLTDISELK